MIKDKSISDYLIELLGKSISLNKEEKTYLIKQLDDINDSDAKKAIKALGDERKNWEALEKQNKKDLDLLERFVEKSKEEIKKMGKKTVKAIEARERKQEFKKAEKLINP